MIYKSEYYNETPIISIIFSYGFKDGKAPNKEILNSNLNFQNYNNNKLVISYNPLDYGKLILEVKLEDYTQYVLQTKGNLVVNIKKFEKHNEIEISSGGKIISKFKDEFISENKFVRILDNKNFYFENNKEILFIKILKSRFISKISPNKNLNNKFIVLDIETYIKDNILIPYLISIYDGQKESIFSI
jgi:hypothetical protein